jgi:hypothetical protein
MEEAIRTKLEGPSNTDGSDGVYARAISLQLRDVALPAEYMTSVSEKQQASEDITLAQNQRSQVGPDGICYFFAQIPYAEFPKFSPLCSEYAQLCLYIPPQIRQTRR